MSRKIAVSFEDEKTIKVVYASEEKGRFLIDKTIILKDDELETFLKMESINDFIITGHFKRTFSDVLSLPPAKKSYFNRILLAEISKRAPELKQFSYSYSFLGKKAEEDKAQDIFCLAVEDDELDGIIERFHRCGKRITGVYSDALLLSQFVTSSGDFSDRTVLCLFVTEDSKNLFLLKNGALRFMRTTPSFGKTVEAVDTDNINMTISYCRQTFKTNPEQLLLLNTAPSQDQPSIGTIVPAVPFKVPDSIIASDETIRDFLVPIAAIASEKIMRGYNLKPAKYRQFSLQKIRFSALIGIFLLLSIGGGFYILKNVVDIFSLKERIATIRYELKGAEKITAEYDSYSLTIQQLLPVINMMNEAHSSPDIQKCLAAYRFLPMKKISIQTVNVANQKDSLKVQIAGGVSAPTFAERHRLFQELIENFRKVAGTTILTQSIELKDGKFQIEVQSNP